MCVHACTCMLANARTCMHIRVHDIVHHVNCARLGRRYCSFSVGRILRQLHPWKSTAFSRGVGAPSPHPPLKSTAFSRGVRTPSPSPPQKSTILYFTRSLRDGLGVDFLNCGLHISRNSIPRPRHFLKIMKWYLEFLKFFKWYLESLKWFLEFLECFLNCLKWRAAFSKAGVNSSGNAVVELGQAMKSSGNSVFELSTL